jgi:diadenosine hexaphosphate hydrolase (ATP-forming)
MSAASFPNRSNPVTGADVTRHPGAVRHRSAGAVVFRGGHVLLLQKANGEWGFPKGHVEPGETARAAARREIREEAGIEADIGQFVGTTSYTFWSGAGRREQRKRVDWFAGTWRSGDPRPEPGIFERARFVPISEAARLLTFADDRDILAQSLARRP